MNKATRTFAATFGAIMALAGLEHGVGELLQGDVAPAGIVIASWPESAFFRNLGGEPAMTVIPNLLIAGGLTILVSLALLIWSLFFVQRKNGGRMMIGLSALLLLVGGGIFPPIFGMLAGAVATRIPNPPSAQQVKRRNGFQALLQKLWPWDLLVSVAGWILVMPVASWWGEENPLAILAILFIALGGFLSAIFSSNAHDLQMLTAHSAKTQTESALTSSGG